MGFYAIKDECLTMEFFIPDSTIYNWDYIRVYARIENGDLVKYKSEIRGEINNYNDIIYKHHNLGCLERKADW